MHNQQEILAKLQMRPNQKKGIFDIDFMKASKNMKKKKKRPKDSGLLSAAEALKKVHPIDNSIEKSKDQGDISATKILR